MQTSLKTGWMGIATQERLMRLAAATVTTSSLTVSYTQDHLSGTRKH